MEKTEKEVREKLRQLCEAAPCGDCTNAVTEAVAWYHGMDKERLNYFSQALLTLLAQPALVSPLLLGIIHRTGFRGAEPMLLAHLYARNFFPPSIMDPDLTPHPGTIREPGPWTDVTRAMVSLQLGRFRVPPAAAVLRRAIDHFMGFSAAARASRSWYGTIRQLFGIAHNQPELPGPSNLNPVPDVTRREMKAHMRALAMIDPGAGVDHIVPTAAYDRARHLATQNAFLPHLVRGIVEVDPESEKALEPLRLKVSGRLRIQIDAARSRADELIRLDDDGLWQHHE